MLMALNEGMTEGDYVYLVPNLLPAKNLETRWNRGDGMDEKARRAYQPVLQVNSSYI
jgi:hypothetical protein